MDDSELIDDGSSQFVVTERDGEQALWVRVGMVFSDNQREKDPGIWIEYQPKYMASSLQGPLLFSVDTWCQLVKAVDAKIKEWERD